MPLALPTTGDDQVAQFQSEWQAAYDGASQEHLEGAKCRLIWALVHAAGSRRHLQRGLELAEAALETDVRTPDEDRELRYYAAGERERQEKLKGRGWYGVVEGQGWFGVDAVGCGRRRRRARVRCVTARKKGEGREGSFPTAMPRWRLWRAPRPVHMHAKGANGRRQSPCPDRATSPPRPPPPTIPQTSLNEATSQNHHHAKTLPSQNLMNTNTATTTTALIVAVAMYNLGDYLRARRALADLLERHPDCRQAAALQEEVTDLVVRNGLIGLGLFGGLVGLGVGLLAATAKRR